MAYEIAAFNVELTLEEIERFNRKLRWKGNCRVWTGERTSKGYGRFHIRGKKIRAHRLAYALKHGPIPADQMVLHSCDTPSCCRPAHLFLGSAADNRRDSQAKGRQGKISLEDAQEIRRLWAESQAARITQTQLGEKFGISGAMVCLIVNNRWWKD